MLKRQRRRTIRNPILAATIKHYLGSGDFNGLPVRTLFNNDSTREAVRTKLRRLILSDKITLEFGLGHPNPYIKAFPPPKSPDAQLKQLAQNDLQHACAYPTPSVLTTVVGLNECQDRPFTRRLMLGEAQLDFHAFDISVLEQYRNDPRYCYENDDISGSISIHDKYSDPAHMPPRDQVLLETFGFGHDDNLNRAVVVFTCYLHGLPAEHQQIWNAKRLEGTYKLHSDYYRNTILGEWGTKLSLFDAFIEELHHINAMAKLMGKPPLFRDEFKEKPRGFSFLVRPTAKELNDFVHLLDKMMADNLNKDFFRGDISLESETARNDGKIVVTQKGTIQLLEQWLPRKFRFSDTGPFAQMIKTFREIRKARGRVAHNADDNVFDPGIFHKQREMAIRAYKAVRTIRLIFANHRAVSGYEISEELFKGEIWTD